MRVTDYDKLQLKLREYADRKALNGEIELANEILKAKCFVDQECEVLDEKQLTNGWIPVSERLPEDIKGNGLVTVLACLKSKDDSLFFSDNTVYQEVTDYITDTQEWEIDNGYEVLAWQPLPEPWREATNEKNN